MPTSMLIMALMGITVAEAYTAMAERGVIIVITEDTIPVDTTEPPVIKGYWPSVVGEDNLSDTLNTKEDKNEPR